MHTHKINFKFFTYLIFENNSFLKINIITITKVIVGKQK